MRDTSAGHDGTGLVSGEDVILLEVLEQGGAHSGAPDIPPATPISPSLKRKGKSAMEGARNFCSFFLGPVFVQAFVLTFLGEWGDRSQIATIALGAAHVTSSR
jgi:Ca2+/H+ antiporter, TMEM165/GDT1 family